MPKLKTETVQVSNAAGETLTLRAEISVSAHGEFRVRVPEELASDSGFMGCLSEARKAHPSVAIKVLQKHTYLTSSSLEPVVPILKNAARRFIDVVTSTERVILYAYRHQVKYALSSDGRVAQNGYLAGEGYVWPEETDSATIMLEDASSHMVAIWARAYDKVTHRRGDNLVISYQPISERNAGDYQSPALRLNAFNTDATIPDMGNGARVRTTGNRARSDYTEIPYTDQAAEYFTRMLLSMCELARRMDEFFGDRDKLQMAIARGVPALLAA
jgi:hypothetical protein